MTGVKESKSFCHGCGEHVDTYLVSRETGAGPSNSKQDKCCIFCGMPVVKLSSKKVIPVNNIIVADDSPMIREMLKDILTDENLARNVTCCDHGADFLSTFTGMAMEGEPPALAVLDLAMPVLNGVNAAIAMRAIEKPLGLLPAPILFFTSQKCDDSFKKVLSYCKPAQYINKGVSSTPELLASRVRNVIIQLLMKSQTLDR